jgi:ABC-type glycerol-3-phosphate transport system substrate-binding protein
MQAKITSQLSRRDFLRLGASLAGVTALVACAPAPGAAPAGGGAAQADAPTGERVEVTFAGWGGTEEDEGVKAAIKQFESEQDKVKVTWLHTPENYLDKMLADIAAGTAPDTAFIPGDMYRTFIRDGQLLDITDQIKADALVGAPDYFIQPQEEQRCAQDGKWYGIGSCWVAPHIYYNADLFTEAGIEPPSNDPAKAWNWDRRSLWRALAHLVDPGAFGYALQRWRLDRPRNRRAGDRFAPIDAGDPKHCRPDAQTPCHARRYGHGSAGHEQFADARQRQTGYGD